MEMLTFRGRSFCATVVQKTTCVSKTYVFHAREKGPLCCCSVFCVTVFQKRPSGFCLIRAIWSFFRMSRAKSMVFEVVLGALLLFWRFLRNCLPKTPSWNGAIWPFFRVSRTKSMVLEVVLYVVLLFWPFLGNCLAKTPLGSCGGGGG